MIITRERLVGWVDDMNGWVGGWGGWMRASLGEKRETVVVLSSNSSEKDAMSSKINTSIIYEI